MTYRPLRTPADFLHAEKRDQAIDDLTKEVNQKIKAIKRRSIAKNVEEAKALTVAEAREMQLNILSQYVFEIALHGLSSSSLDLDDSRFIDDVDIFMAGDFDLRKDYLEKAAKEGEKMGTADFLEMLVPEDITDMENRELYFLSWTKQALQRHRGFHEGADGTAALSFPTKLPGIEVTYKYGSDSNFPKRMIGLAKK